MLDINNKLVIRKATAKDCLAVFQLSNQPVIRNSSFHPEKIKLIDHKNWYQQKITDPNCLFFIADLAGTIVAQLRLDTSGTNALISISTDKIYQGLGIGTRMIRHAIDYLKSQKTKIKTISAYVKKNNRNSIKFFEAMRFKLAKDIVVNNQKASCYILNLK